MVTQLELPGVHVAGGLTRSNNQDQAGLQYLREKFRNARNVAVVASSGSLLYRGYGAEIDASDLVMRFNGAITKGYHEDCGRAKDTGRTKGMIRMAWQAGMNDLNDRHLLAPNEFVLRIHPGGEANCDWFDVGGRRSMCVRTEWTRDVYSRVLESFGGWPSTGFVGLAVAVALAQEVGGVNVNVYGFGACRPCGKYMDCDGSNATDPDPKNAEARGLTYYHPFGQERLVRLRWARAGVINLFEPACDDFARLRARGASPMPPAPPPHPPAAPPPPPQNFVQKPAWWIGDWGGKCTCPNGEEYWVGDHKDNCQTMACHGGVSGTCHHYPGKWSKGKANCFQLDPPPPPVLAGAYPMARGCDEQLNTFCQGSCPGTVLARFDTDHDGSANAWRCYDLESLSDDRLHYRYPFTGYCTRPYLESVIDECLAPSEPPPAPPPPRPPPAPPLLPTSPRPPPPSPQQVDSSAPSTQSRPSPSSSRSSPPLPPLPASPLAVNGFLGSVLAVSAMVGLVLVALRFGRRATDPSRQGPPSAADESAETPESQRGNAQRVRTGRVKGALRTAGKELSALATSRRQRKGRCVRFYDEEEGDEEGGARPAANGGGAFKPDEPADSHSKVASMELD